jgi:hypothetical protein
MEADEMKKRYVTIRETPKTEYLFRFLDQLAQEEHRSRAQIVLLILNDEITRERGGKAGKQQKVEA